MAGHTDLDIPAGIPYWNEEEGLMVYNTTTGLVLDAPSVSSLTFQTGPGAVPQPTSPADQQMLTDLALSNITNVLTGSVAVGGVGTGIKGGLMVTSAFGKLVRPAIGPILGVGMKAWKRVPGTTTVKQAVIIIGGGIGLDWLFDQFDADTDSARAAIENIIDFLDAGLQDGSIMWPVNRKGDNAGEQIAPNYLTFDLNKGTGWIHQEYFNKNFIDAVRRNERTPRYKGTPSPKRSR